MRKRTVKNLFDNIMWYTIYLLPILIALVVALGYCGCDWFAPWVEWDGDVTNPPAYLMFKETLFECCYQFQFAPIYTALEECFYIFGENIVPFEISILTHYFAYFISVYIAHLFVDFVLFIPRLCHKWMNAFTNAE